MKKLVGSCRFKAYFSEPLAPLKCIGKLPTHIVEIHRRGGRQEDRMVVAPKLDTKPFITGEIRERRVAMAAY